MKPHVGYSFWSFWRPNRIRSILWITLTNKKNMQLPSIALHFSRRKLCVCGGVTGNWFTSTTTKSNIVCDRQAMHVRDVPDKFFDNAYAAAKRIEWTPNPICWPGGIKQSKFRAEDRMKLPFFRLISQTNSLQRYAGTPVCRQNISMPKKKKMQPLLLTQQEMTKVNRKTFWHLFNVLFFLCSSKSIAHFEITNLMFVCTENYW